jgi:hypothetical protein
MKYDVQIEAEAKCEAFVEVEADSQEEAEQKAKGMIGSLSWDVIEPPKDYDVWMVSADPQE